MNAWRKLTNNNNYFFVPYVIFFFIGSIVILATEQSNLHLFFNSFHNRFLDRFFYYITYLGDGIFALVLFIIFLFVKYRSALIIGISSLVAGLITQILKNYVFFDELRPKKFFEGIRDLYFIPNVENFDHYSFPSGHSTVAFAICTSFIFLVKNNNSKLALILSAIIIAFSRVYLSQHFFEDIFAGSIIGCVTACGVYLLFSNPKENSKLDRSLLTFFKKQ